MSAIRFIVEVDTARTRLDGLAGHERTDAIVDALIEAFDTPEVEVLDVAEPDEPAWLRTSRF